MGELDNTIVIFTSDNGASREGEVEGTTGYFVHLLGETDLEADLARIDGIGGPTSIPHYPRGWAMACDTPFRLYKINTHAGGHQVPLIFNVAAAPSAAPGSWRDQYTYVTDMLPTLLELCGLSSAGRAQRPRTQADGRRELRAGARRSRRAAGTTASSTPRWSATAASTATGGRS